MKKRSCSILLLMLAAACVLISVPVLATEPPQTDQAKQTTALVDKAVDLLASKGKSAFPEFKVKGGPWLQGETYVYVYDLKGTLLMHPIYPFYEGVNLINLRDIHMKAFVEQLVSLANSKGSGWFDFMLPKPGQATPSHKYAYIKTVKLPEGETVVVGSGFWAP